MPTTITTDWIRPDRDPDHYMLDLRNVDTIHEIRTRYRGITYYRSLDPASPLWETYWPHPVPYEHHGIWCTIVDNPTTDNPPKWKHPPSVVEYLHGPQDHHHNGPLPHSFQLTFAANPNNAYTSFTQALAQIIVVVGNVAPDQQTLQNSGLAGTMLPYINGELQEIPRVFNVQMQGPWGTINRTTDSLLNSGLTSWPHPMSPTHPWTPFFYYQRPHWNQAVISETSTNIVYGQNVTITVSAQDGEPYHARIWAMVRIWPQEIIAHMYNPVLRVFDSTARNNYWQTGTGSFGTVDHNEVTDWVEIAQLRDHATAYDWEKHRYTVRSGSHAAGPIASSLRLGAFQLSYDVTYTAAEPVVTTDDASNILDKSAQLNAEVTDTGGENPNRYFRWGETSESLDNIEDCGVHPDADEDTYYTVINDLDPQTTYYFQAYAENSAGIGEGDIKSFTTAIPAPQVETLTATDLSHDQARIRGNVVETNGPDPVRFIRYGISADQMSQVIDCGTGGTGEYSAMATSLIPNKTYYFQAYATNANGTGYGNIKAFKMHKQPKYIEGGAFSAFEVVLDKATTINEITLYPLAHKPTEIVHIIAEDDVNQESHNVHKIVGIYADIKPFSITREHTITFESISVKRIEVLLRQENHETSVYRIPEQYINSQELWDQIKLGYSEHRWDADRTANLINPSFIQNVIDRYSGWNSYLQQYEREIKDWEEHEDRVRIAWGKYEEALQAWREGQS